FTGLIATSGAAAGPLEEPFEPGSVTVIDVARLGSDEQDLVFAAFITKLRERMEEGTLGVGKMIVVVDELNKYAPSGGGETYVAASLKEIAARGRYLGLTLFGAQQFRSRVDKEVVGNVATHAFGHVESEELAQPSYSHFSPAVKEKLGSLQPGEVLIKHPHFAQPIFVRFPNPCVMKGGDGLRKYPKSADQLFGELAEGFIKRLAPADLNRALDALAKMSDDKDAQTEVLRGLRRANSADECLKVLERAPRKAPIGLRENREPTAVVATGGLVRSDTTRV
ncbi:MAG: ATP-binding protein, partial [Fimbriimonas ginsengisoli]|nr:ATP-binding protein [Fimbriimonas ginsengisoli]